MEDDSINLKVTNRFYFLYFSLLLFVVSKNFIYYYFHRDDELVLVLGIALVVSIILISSAALISAHVLMLQGSFRTFIHLIIYLLTGLLITACESSHIIYLQTGKLSRSSVSFLPMSVFVFMGSKPFLVSRPLYYLSSLLNLTLFSIISILSSSARTETALSCALLFVSAYFKSSDLKRRLNSYKIMITEQDNPNIQSELMTPLDEIVTNTRHCIKKLTKISKLASPKLFKTYEKMKTKLEVISKNLQSSNIYSPRLEAMTRNMDLENRLFIEQEFFDSHGSSMVNSEHISPQKPQEYSLADLQGILSHIGKEWNFDTFFVADCTSEPLVVIGEYSIRLYQLDSVLKISPVILNKFLKGLQENYFENPYHNSIHGADVLCSFLYLVNTSTIKKMMSSLEWLGSILACLAHDIRHPAMNNRYLVMTQHEYALTYNDISVLEMMHAATFFKLAQEKGLNVFLNFSNEKFQMIRKLIIELILATDMTKHFEIIGCAKTKYSDSIDFSNYEHRLDVFKLIIKAADVGHAAKSVDLHEKWCKKVIEEFYAQGDLEKKRGLPVSMFCDRENTNISKSQTGFIKNVVLILYETLNSLVKSEEIEQKCLAQLRSNQRFWETLAMRIQSEQNKENGSVELNGKHRKVSL